MMTSPEQTIHIIDDDKAMRDSLSFLLHSAGKASRSYTSAKAFLDSGIDDLDGCIITDVRMPDMNGLELLAELKARGTRAPIIIMTGHGDIPLAVEALKAGAADFLEKPFDDQIILQAIQKAMTSAPDSESDTLKDGFVAELATLSPREKDVLLGVVNGKPNKVIARELGISPRTVEVYRAHVMSKTGAHSLSDLVRMSIAVGL